ncbi:THAP domain-containing protein 1-like [Sinocyclocheilus anshuiensis]|uniref:THAP domain-containing protein 1-like n=1 Tax=Sinocyclocheilus anshuiensis TaxID=1608454 RepID=UPI0007B9F1CE|nr:PREDICTED: THAP domain-containing protein 1-like [Sinocyclocheilus anshuiensis]
MSSQAQLKYKGWVSDEQTSFTFTRDAFETSGKTRPCPKCCERRSASSAPFGTRPSISHHAASLEESFSADLAFPLSLPLSDAAVCPSEAEPAPLLHTSAFVSCDHNYTVEDTLQQKRCIEQLQEQMEKLRKRLKMVQQKCRRQERQLERFRAMSEVQRDTALGDSYVVLPKEIYDVLKGIETIGEDHPLQSRTNSITA